MRRARAVLRRVNDDADGVSLVESLIAVFILAIAVLALAATAASSTASLRLSRDRQQATQAASAAIEDVRALEYGDIVLFDDGSLPALDPHQGESVVKSASGQLDALVVEGRFSTELWVTWADGTSTLKRVTAVTTWQDRGTDRTVSETTLVAAARRGLPAPDFLINPDDSTATGSPGATVHFTHQLLNLGERDRYSFVAGLDDGAGGFVVGRSVFQGPDSFLIVDDLGGSWIARGVFDGTAMSDTTGDGRPNTVDPLGRRESAELRFSFEPTGAGPHDTTPTFRVRVHSVFDDTVFKDVVERVSETEVRTRLFLAKGGNNNRSRFELTTQTPVRTAGDPDDYDSPSDGVPGLRFRQGQSSDRANWDMQPGAGKRVEGPATLTLWIATPETLGGTDGGDPGPGPVTFQVTIQKVRANNGSVVDTLYNAPHTVPTSALAAPWNQVPLALDGLLPSTFTDTELLRLSIVMGTGGTGSEAVSHVHFDVDYSPADSTDERYLSALELKMFTP